MNSSDPPVRNKWVRPESPLTGYTGFVQGKKYSGMDSPPSPSREPIRGYTGFLPDARGVCGRPTIPGQEEQKHLKLLREGTTTKKRTKSASSRQKDNSFRKINSKTMDLVERYDHAATRLFQDRGQTHEMLVRIVQAKLSERVASYAEQLIRVRKLFEAHDADGNGVLDEDEFRSVLEKINVQFDDVQSLALFSYFDTNNTGKIEWEEFARVAMVANPRGGTAVLPKAITSTAKSGSWEQLECSSFGIGSRMRERWGTMAPEDDRVTLEGSDSRVLLA